MLEQRAPDNSIGGGQIAANILLEDLPLGFSVANENYTKSRDPTERYEIDNLLVASAYYVQPIETRVTRNLYLGAGIGRLKIPQGETAPAYQVSALVDTQLAWRISGYVETKYLYSNQGAVDFSDFGFVIGIGVRVASW